MYKFFCMFFLRGSLCIFKADVLINVLKKVSHDGLHIPGTFSRKDPPPKDL